MTISITSLSPTKGQDNVSVNSDIEVSITSDVYDLDLDTIRFFINGIEVSVSSYYGLDKKIIDTVFYSRRLIRYGTGRNYGETDLTYGQRDILSSILCYGSVYSCSISVQDIEGNVFEENFSFTVEDGIFYNSIVSDYFYFNQTQSMANYTPEWARARYDKHSNFQQMINPVCSFMEEIEAFLFQQKANYYVQSANLNELATLHKIELGRDYDFKTIVLDDGNSLQVPPDITALSGVTKFYPVVEYDNDLKSFYYNKIPSRLDLSKENVSSLDIVPERDIVGGKLYLNYDMEREGDITFLIKEGEPFSQVINEEYQFLTCRIEGESRERKRQFEDIIFIDDDNYKSKKLWKRIDSIQFLNIVGEAHGRFSIRYNKRYDEGFVLDSVKHVSVDGSEKGTFWKKAETTYGSVLQQWVLLDVDPGVIATTGAKKDIVAEHELLDIDNQTNLNLVDLDFDHFSNFFYGIDNNYLYLFDKREEYSSLANRLPSNNGVSDFVLEIVDDGLGREDTTKEVEISAVQKLVGKEIVNYRISIEKPDGSLEYLLLDGSTTTDLNDGIIRNVSPEIQIKTRLISYSLTDLGDYLIRLRTNYRSGEQEEDMKIIRLRKKSALAKYKLEKFLQEETVEAMFIDFDQQVKIYDSAQRLHTVSFARDNALVDYANGTLYFNESYDQVEVE